MRYRYKVKAKTTKEIEEFCYVFSIKIVKRYNCVNYYGTKAALERLHQKFYNQSELKLEQI